MLNRIKMCLADFFQQADLVLLGFCCTATTFGLFLIASATRYKGFSSMMRFIGVQGVAMLIGICCYIVLSMVDLDAVIKKWKWLALFNLLFIGLLRTPLGVGGLTNGNQAWLKIPGIPLQIGPAEFVKITFTLLLAKQMEWLRDEKRDLKSFSSAFQVAGHTLILIGWYVLISGDMGNALTFFFIFLCMAFAAGFALRWFALLFAGAGAGVVAALALGLVKDYMKKRFIVLFDHSFEPAGVGLQQSRSLLAIGSGGFFGQGYMHGTLTQAGSSIPYQWTDFIFAVCGEELGMVGCIAVMALLTAIIFRVLFVAKNSLSNFHRYVCIGVAAMMIYQTIINIGMCLFVMPTIGVTLPFFSYGGSSIVTLFMSMGIVSGIKKRSPNMRKPGHPIRGARR